MNRLTGKVAAITGGARGLGAAIARRFQEEGATIVIVDLNGEAAAKTAGELGGTSLQCDVADSASVARVFSALDERHGRLDILVNNAGISGMEGHSEHLAKRSERTRMQAEEIARGGPIETHLDVTVELADDDWHRMIGVHLNGTFFCTREALKIMNRSDSGAIVNMGSIMGTAGGGASPHYSAAKAGILGLTRALARELATRNIRVNAIAPGWIDTDMTAPLGDLRHALAQLTPLGRFGDVDDIAWAAVYLASAEAKYLTGQVISPNGGYVMSQ
ncbi:MAG: 3-oxoacyl-[acyl-carrier protein] reductase [Gammaproteobacteria bacterium]|jgi:3-oxoacyl-[acyl-carrier protein] reductase